jgi:hypothetical protein
MWQHRQQLIRSNILDGSRSLIATNAGTSLFRSLGCFLKRPRLRQIALVVLLCSCAWGRDTEIVTVNIVSWGEPETMTHSLKLRWESDGLTSFSRARITANQEAATARAVLNSRRVLLACVGLYPVDCYALRAGIYQGELQGRWLWITTTISATNQTVKGKFEIVGLW